jgi:hypothetical protein
MIQVGSLKIQNCLNFFYFHILAKSSQGFDGHFGYYITKLTPPKKNTGTHDHGVVGYY